MRDVAVRTAALPALPVELWAYIVNLSSHLVCLKISRVSRLHRALTLPVLFESLNLTVPRVTIEQGESGSDKEAKRLQEYLRLYGFLKKVATGGTPILRSLRRLSIHPLVEDPAWELVNGKRLQIFIAGRVDRLKRLAPITAALINRSPAPGDPVSAETYPKLRDRLSDVIFNASSLVTFRWNSNVVPFPNTLGQALVLGAPQLQCLYIRSVSVT